MLGSWRLERVVGDARSGCKIRSRKKEEQEKARLKSMGGWTRGEIRKRFVQSAVHRDMDSSVEYTVLVKEE